MGLALDGAPGMLDAALRLAAAAGIAIGIGLGVRALLFEALPGMGAAEVLTRIAALCTVGIAAYAGLARLFGVAELAELERLLMRRFRLRAPG